MPTPARWHADAAAILDREQRRHHAADDCDPLQREHVDAIVAGMPPLPRTPQERERIPNYGDLASSVIWYPVYAEEGVPIIVCQNCRGQFEQHDQADGLCPSIW